MQEKPLLLLQLDLYAHAVKHLDLDSDGGHGCSIDQCPDPQIVETFNAVDGSRKIPRQLGLYEAQPDNRSQKHDLPVEEAWARQVSSNQPEHALVDERRKRPDVILVSR